MTSLTINIASDDLVYEELVSQLCGYKMTNGSRYASYSLRTGEATKETIVCGREQWVNGNLQSMSASRMVTIQPIL